jgi:hypothetical protein
MTPTVRTTRMVCEQCDFSCVAQLSIILTVRSSERPNPEVCLPFSSQTRSVPRLRPANDDAPIPANDDAIERPPAAVGDPMTPV